MRFFLFLLLFVPISLVKASTYYFSSTGSDGRSSKQAQNPTTPWKTIDKLNSFFNQLSPGDIVLFKSGETFYGTIKCIENGKMKSRSTPITIGSYGDGPKPIITSLQPVTGWTSLGNQIYEKQDKAFPDTLLNLVLVNGQVQAMGRWPKVGTTNNGYLTYQSHLDTFSITSDAISSAKSFIGGEVVIRKIQWVFDRATVTNQTENTVSYTPFLSPNHPSVTYEPIDNYGFFFQNHISTLTNNGDWCYDRSAKKLRMFSNSGQPFNVSVPTLAYLVDMAYQENVIFKNLSFKGSNLNTVNIRLCSNIQINNCDIDCSGVNGVSVYHNFASNAVKANGGKTTTSISSGSSNNIKVSNCNITNTINNAIEGGNATNWTIQNNLIERTGLIAGMGVSGDGHYNAIQYVNSNSLVENNKIFNTGYLGIHFLGDNTIVRNNYVDNYCLIKSDGGGIYTFGDSGKNRRVTNNVVSNGIGDLNGTNFKLPNPYAGQVHGIYMDAWTGNVTIDNNTCFNNAATGLFIGSSNNINVNNNVFYDNKVAQVKTIDSHDSLTNINIQDNILVATEKGQLVASYKTTWRNRYNAYKMGEVDNNYYCRPLYEPENIKTQGYPNASDPNNIFKDYPGGGIVEASDGEWGTTLFYSLDRWNTSFQLSDKNTKKSPFTIDNLDKIRFEFNATNTPKIVSLDGAYVDMKNNSFSGSITVAPYRSIVLLKAPTQAAPTTYATNVSPIEIHNNVVGPVISAFPNPSKTTTTIQITPSETGSGSVEVFDQQGRPVKRLFSGSLDKGTPKRFVLNLEGLSAGEYVVRFVTKTTVVTKRITVVR